MFTYIKANSIGSGVELSIKALNDFGKFEQRENQDTEDCCKEIQLCLDIEKPILTEVGRSQFISKAVPCGLDQLIDYDQEFLHGTADNAGWKYTYHSLYKPYYTKVIDEFKRNPNSRRACIALGQGDINFTSDPPCLQLLMFNVVDEMLEMTAVFRSNDAIKAFPMNIHALSLLQLNLANELVLGYGDLHYIANNFHAYSRDFKLMAQYVKNFDEKLPARRFWSWNDLVKEISKRSGVNIETLE